MVDTVWYCSELRVHSRKLSININETQRKSCQPAMSEQPKEEKPATVSQSEYDTQVEKLNQDAKAYIARQTKPVIIPSFAKWFDMTKIHDIEKKSLPEYFNNESRFKTPKVYKDFRDFMINAYRLNPLEYLTITAVRRNLAD
ncbi:unnamed protein product [Ambrosiozyma monospora]|uniref:Unnamed protein product n=1 Tax=Ambrosiozyma monospora TaxID=43982 RepID=A0A9W6Z0E7_AMBMO|nr:unnamed protein product [Ambrosiozyma monospora]